MEYQQALRLAAKSNAILFIGAGFSITAKNIKGNNILPGGKFAEYLYQKCGLPGDNKLGDAAEEFIEMFGADDLVEELKYEFTCLKPSEEQISIAKIKWKRIYTTNYDNVMERSYEINGKQLIPLTLSSRVAGQVIDHRICMHFNGFIDSVTRDSLWNSFKLTDSSYLTTELLSSDWLSVFADDLIAASSIFFVGYSLSDLDIRRILYQNQTNIDKTFFIVEKTPDPKLVRLLNKFGTVMNIGTERFSKDLNAALIEVRNDVDDPLILSSFSSYQQPKTMDSYADSDFYNLLVYGNINSDFVWRSLQDTNTGPYYLRRKDSDILLNYLRDGNKYVVVHADLGNGKTLFIEGIKYQLYTMGFKVFNLVERRNEVHAELGGIIKQEGQKVIILENYYDELDLVRFIHQRKDNDTYVILTARSTINDLLIAKLYDILRGESIVDLDLNTMATADLSSLSLMLSHYGYWGGSQALSQNQKVKKLQEDYQGEWCSILVDLFKSPDIKSRLKTIITPINERKEFHEVMISLLVLNVIGVKYRVETLFTLVGHDVMNTINFRNNQTIRELINLSRGVIEVKSSILAKFILSEIIDTNLVVKIIVNIAKRADNLANKHNVFSQIIRQLMRFGNLQQLLPSEQRREAVIDIYQQIKGLRSCASNPYYWLQYAIARLVFNEFELSNKMFEAAYSLAKRSETFDSFQIDNHYARYLFQKAIAEGSEPNPMKIFKQGRKIIEQQIRSGPNKFLYYPYRVAILYYDFYQEYERVLSDGDKVILHKAAEFVQQRLSALPQRLRERIEVSICADKMTKLIGALHA